jgi:hypothetical protein
MKRDHSKKRQGFRTHLCLIYSLLMKRHHFSLSSPLLVDLIHYFVSNNLISIAESAFNLAKDAN